MSSILAALDMSLDDIIAKKKKSSNPDARPARKQAQPQGQGQAQAAASSAGPVRNNRRNRRNNRNQPYARQGQADDDDMMDVEDDGAAPAAGRRAGRRRGVDVKLPKKKGGAASILSRVGGAAPTQGTKILVKNLKFDIMEDDMRELFETVGKVTKAEIVYDRSGRSKGIARVWFAKRADAERAIKQFDGRELDHQKMFITLDTDSNVREGLFGTALATREADGVKFKVNLGGGKSENRNGGGRGARRGRGGRGGRGGNGGGAKSSEDLDNEMDAYMKDA
ncbi:hypothetical protein PINS_up011245 [Pythium insidiosum]|nr:hypothetical protein PINS_up011245 [Pythium insidiosum]